NCSYNLLFLLEAARPQVKLTDRMGTWVIPADTVRVVREEGLIERVKYRPSQAGRIRTIAATLDSGQKLAARDLAQGEKDISSLNSETARGTLDLAAELLQYRYARRELEKEAFNMKFLSILTFRSTLASRKVEDYRIDPPPQPEDGHNTGRFSFSAGSRDDAPFVEAGWRPAYHDLLDPEPGYVDGAQINFMDTLLRYYPRENAIRLHKLHLVDIVSLTPWDLFFRRISWKVSAGFDQEVHRDGRDHLLFRLNTGGGIASPVPRVGLAYVVGETDVNFGDRLRNNGALGFGANAGILAPVSKVWKMNLSGQVFYYPVGDEHLSVRGGIATDYSISRNQSIRLSIEMMRSFNHELLEVRGGWNLFL
ncbi:MAG TPA: hypothetical protein VHN82_05490, partial [Methanoregula sp.]|nr:hypothetical protein [Methanoregula sp.]